MKRILIACLLAGLAGAAGAAGAADPQHAPATATATGVRMIPIHTEQGEFRVRTRRVGDNPAIKVLLLHGGPGATHDYLEAVDKYFQGASIEYYYYERPGSAFGDQPDDPAPYDLRRFTGEVEQVRAALGLDKDDFYLLGDSWGGPLAIEYALAYPGRLKGLVISNMVASAPAHDERFADLGRIEVPTLVIGARDDTMGPDYLKKMAQRLKHGQFLDCAKGSHMAMYDDQQCYFDGLLKFLHAAPARTPSAARQLRHF